MFSSTFLFGLMIILVMVMLFLTSSKFINYFMKWNQYECGFKKNSKTYPNFSIQFFMVGVLFLIFDAEIIILIPALFSETISSLQMMSLVLFLLVLSLILFAEWKNGMILWSK